MRHDLRFEGALVRLRPVGLADAQFIIDLRTDPQLSRYVHATSADPAQQRAWIERYFERDGDYYFIIEDKDSAIPQGTIAIYNLDPATAQAEWGRWILRAGSLAAVESVLLIYRLAFTVLELDTLYCRTVADNEKVVSFHTSCGLEHRGILPNEFNTNGVDVDAVEQRATRAMLPDLEAKMAPLAERMRRMSLRGAKP